MSAYNEIKDLYNFYSEEFNPELTKGTVVFDETEHEGYYFTTPKGKYVFAYRTEGTMGNHWLLYDIYEEKHLITGRHTRKQIIEDAILL